MPENKRRKEKVISAVGILATATAFMCFCMRVAALALPAQPPESLPEPTFSSSQVSSPFATSREESTSVASAPPKQEASPSSSEAQSSTPPDGDAIPIVETSVGGGAVYGNINIKSDTGAPDIDFTALLSNTPAFTLPADGAPAVLLYHTHTSEAYLSEDADWFYEGTETRTDDASRSVVAVGEAVADELERAGIGVIHDTEIHDYMYSGAYDRSEAKARALMEEYPTISVTIDLHRDAIGSDGRVKPTALINGKKAAQLMIMSGYDLDGSLEFPGWEDNLCLAVQLQDILEKNAPGITRPLYFCNRRYNMHLTPASLLIEVGTEVSDVDEAIYTGTILGKALAEELLKFSGT